MFAGRIHPPFGLLWQADRRIVHVHEFFVNLRVRRGFVVEI